MRKIKIVCVLLLTLFVVETQGDIIISSYAKISARITNLDEFSNYTFFGVWDCISMPGSVNHFKIEPNVWFKKFGLCPVSVFAIKKKHLKKVNLDEIDWNDNQYVIKSNLEVEVGTEELNKKIRLVELDYKIAGFKDKIAELYLSKRVYKRSFKSTPDEVKEFEYEGDLSQLSKDVN